MGENYIPRQKPKIERISAESYRANLPNGRSTNVPITEIVIWDMVLPRTDQNKYRALDYQTVKKPYGLDDVRIDFDAKLTPNQMFALHNRIASVTSWFPIESSERPWKKIFSKFQTMVLYKGNIPIGIAHFTKPELGDKTIELKYLGLREDMIGRGLGRYFATSRLAYVAQHYPDHQIILGTTSFDIFNKKLALDFHKHMGFVLADSEPLKKQIIDTRVYYKIPEVVARHHNRYAKEFPEMSETLESRPSRDVGGWGQLTSTGLKTPSP